MNLLKKVLNKKVGAAPGEISYVGETEPEKTSIRLIQYDQSTFMIAEIDSLKTLLDRLDYKKVNWVQITGLSNHPLITEIALHFGIHSLSLEDAFNTEHMPKYEEVENYMMFITKGFLEDLEDTIHVNSMCLFLFENALVSIQDKKLDLLDIKIQRIEQAKGKARLKKADYLFFLVLDAFIDTFYSSFDNIRESLLNLEDNLLYNRSQNYVEDILNMNKKLSYLRKIIFPLRSALITLLNSEAELFYETNEKYLNDLKDHVDELIEHHNSFNDYTKSLVTLNDNNLNTDTNKVMKILTIIATIFIPLTFIAGIYGMNFHNMPELSWQYGYPLILALMFVIGFGLFMYMKFKKWF